MGALLPLLDRNILLGWCVSASDLLIEFLKPWMLQCSVRADPAVWSQLKHAAQQVQSDGIDLREQQPQVLRRKLLKVVLIFWKRRDPRPCSLGWSAHQSEDFVKLVFIRRAWK